MMEKEVLSEYYCNRRLGTLYSFVYSEEIVPKGTRFSLSNQHKAYKLVLDLQMNVGTWRESRSSCSTSGARRLEGWSFGFLTTTTIRDKRDLPDTSLYLDEKKKNRRV